MTASEIDELIRALKNGTMSTDEVAEQFRRRSWPSNRRPSPRKFLEMAEQAESDPYPDVPGSYDDVTAAYDRGDLTSEQYDVLSEAVAASIRTESRAAGS
jgi:hypothetical protein